MMNTKSEDEEQSSIPGIDIQTNQLSILEIESTSQSNTFDPHYLTSCFNLKYKRIGKVLAFHFDSTGNPRCAIGPSWGFFIILMAFTIYASGFIYLFFTKAGLPLLFHFIYLLCLCNFIGVYIVNLLVNPGVVFRSRSDKPGKYCHVCKIYVPNDVKADHCSICEVCVEDHIEIDHHCVWMTKCVGRRNKKWFYCFIASFALFYATIIGGVLYLNFQKRK